MKEEEDELGHTLHRVLISDHESNYTQHSPLIQDRMPLPKQQTNQRCTRISRHETWNMIYEGSDLSHLIHSQIE